MSKLDNVRLKPRSKLWKQVSHGLDQLITSTASVQTTWYQCTDSRSYHSNKDYKLGVADPTRYNGNFTIMPAPGSQP